MRAQGQPCPKPLPAQGPARDRREAVPTYAGTNSTHSMHPACSLVSLPLSGTLQALPSQGQEAERLYQEQSTADLVATSTSYAQPLWVDGPWGRVV